MSGLHKYHLLLILLLAGLPFSAHTQTIQGKVTGNDNAPLAGASVSWLGKKTGSITQPSGEFNINATEKFPASLIISFAGYQTDTVSISNTEFINIRLQASGQLAEVVIESKQKASYISSDPIKTEVITSLELKKAACCDLAGCFETQSTVQPQTTNIITNSKELRILGLSGIYNQVLIDGFPQIQALSYTYGISSIPGPLVENIWVAKGANSVLQGFESISGQINVITQDPTKADKLKLNAYVNSFGEKQFNGIYAIKKEKWSNLTAFHTAQPGNRIDKDEDGFMDLPLITRYMIMNKSKLGDEAEQGWSAQLTLRYLSEKRIGGQTDFQYNRDKGGSNFYGQAVNINQPEAMLKTAYRFNDAHRIVFMASSFHQEQQSYFGITDYKAEQTNAYANIQYEYSYGENNNLKTGFSYRFFDLNERIAFTENSLNRTYAGSYLKKEKIPGVFAENSISLAENKLTWITGLRADHHNIFGWQLTPRTLLKYDPTPLLAIRASAGTGWRTANIFSENVGLLASSRDIIFAEPLKPEKAINLGVNVTQKFNGEDIDGYVSLDFYHTRFSNQIFPDYDDDPRIAIIRNFTGTSVSNGFQAEASLTMLEKISARLGYVYLDVFQERNNIKYVLPFNPKHRLVGSASFMPLSKKWHFDMNVHWYGKQRLPDTRQNPVEYQRPDFSEAYNIVSAQYTYSFKKFEVYAGCENIFNFRQNRPIIGWEEPFGPYFDTQFAWGPTRGIEMYAGMRFVLK